MARRIKARFKSLRALISALSEGAMTQAEVESALDAVQMGIGLSKRDKALGQALENTGEDKDSPKYWDGFRDGLVYGYSNAQQEQAQGKTLRPIAELIEEAKAEAAKEGTAN